MSAKDTTKDSAKSVKRAATQAQAALKTKKKVTVVDVTLPSAAPKRMLKGKAQAKPAASRTARPLRRPPVLSAKRGLAAKPAAKTQTRNTTAQAAARQSAPAQTVEEQQGIVAPTPEMLKNFRRACKASRTQAKKNLRTTKTGGAFLAKPNKAGKKYLVDLRVHSPGTEGYFSVGGVDPGPAVVSLAKVKGLDVIAVTDSFNASYIDIVRQAAERTKMCVIPGVTLRCSIGACREVYLIALFPESYTGADIFTLLEELGVPREMYGRGDYCLELPFESILQAIESRGGVAIPSRIDKTPYRLLSASTLIEEYGFHAFDLVYPDNTEYFRDRWPGGEFTILTFSKANALGQIGSRVAKVRLLEPGFAGIKALVKRRAVESAGASTAESAGASNGQTTA